MRRFLYGTTLGLLSGSTVQAQRKRTSHSPPLLVDVLPDSSRTFEYDLVVVGGGSGGLAAARRAAQLGAKVALCDLVTPSETKGTIWGLGGTCVNVGCIPKKLMHSAATQRQQMGLLAEAFGFDGAAPPGDEKALPVVSWEKLRDNVDNYIRSLNFGYVTQMMDANVKYVNARARLVDAHTIECTNRRGVTSTMTARRVLLAMGGRPVLPDDVRGAREHGVTSDDIFRQQEDPGNTLVVGASYVALECAGMLHGIGRSATVMMRSVPLRGFDTDMAQRVVGFMERSGVRFLRQAVPVELTKQEDGGVSVLYRDSMGEERRETYQTVLFATGRRPETRGMGLEAAGVTMAPSGKVVVDPYDRTSVPHIYAIGDVAEGGLELTPVAIHAGRLLAERLYGKGEALMSYQNVPTTVFTPLEYGCVGMSEDTAAAMYGDDLEVYHTHFNPLSWSMAHVHDNECYMKMLVRKSDDRVLGFHLLSPDAGEVVQGVAVALQCGAKKSDFDRTIGIHPTIAEDITQLSITKASGVSPLKSGC